MVGISTTKRTGALLFSPQAKCSGLVSVKAPMRKLRRRYRTGCVSRIYNLPVLKAWWQKQSKKQHTYMQRVGFEEGQQITDAYRNGRTK
jgi:hypothetical protein